MVAVTRRSYGAGNFELQIDGFGACAYVRSVDGGWSRGVMQEEEDLVTSEVKKFTAVVIDPITVELGLMSSVGMLRWIQRTWNRCQTQRRNGQLSYADFNLRTLFEHEFFNALLTQVTFPALDGASKEGGYLKCTLQPERVWTSSRPTPGPQIWGIASRRQKMWSPSAFRFNIDGIEDMHYTNHLDSFSVTMNTSKLPTGAWRLAEIEPFALKFSNLTGTISLRYADSLIKWHKEYIRGMDGGGTKDEQALKTGSIEFLTPDCKQTICRINLEEVGMTHVSPVQPNANADQIRRVRFELFVGKMTFEGSKLLGFI